MQRRLLEAPMGRIDCIVFSPVKRGTKPRQTLEEIVRRDLMVNCLS